METKRLVVATLVGSIALYVTGYLIFTVAFAEFYQANVGTATGVNRGGELFWAIFLANVAYAALITYAIGNRAGSLSTTAGMMSGAVVGFLLWTTADFVFYGSTNVANLTRTIVDPLLEIVHGGIGGGIIALVLTKMRAVQPASFARV